jgi:hypothetical protein
MSASTFALNWKKNTTESFKVLQVAYGEQTMRKTQVSVWLSKFKAV